jgi:hypothetical protein
MMQVYELDKIEKVQVPERIREVAIEAAAVSPTQAATFLSRVLPRLPVGLRRLQMPDVSHLIVYDSAIFQRVVDALTRFHELEHLDVRGQSRGADVDGMIAILQAVGASLRTFDAWGILLLKLSISEMKRLRFPQMRKIPHVFVLPWEDPDFLPALADVIPRLEEVEVRSLPRTPAAFSTIPRFAELRSLRFCFWRAGDGRDSEGHSSWNGSDVSRVLVQCPSLTSLAMAHWAVPFTNEDWKTLFDGASSLTALHFTECPLPSPSLEFLRQPSVRRQLQSLSLVEVIDPITASDLTHIQSLAGLTSLTLSRLRIISKSSFDVLSLFGSCDVLPSLSEFQYAHRGLTLISVKWSRQLGMCEWRVVQEDPALGRMIAADFRTDRWQADTVSAKLPPPPPSPPKIPLPSRIASSSSGALSLPRRGLLGIFQEGLFMVWAT